MGIIATHQSYVDGVKAALDRIGKTKSTQPPVSNDEGDTVAQEFALANAMRQWVDKRYIEAKAAIGAILPPPPPEPGQYMLHDSGYTSVVATVRAPARTLDAGLVATLVAERLDIDTEEAEALIKEHCYSPAKASVMLTVTLKK